MKTIVALATAKGISAIHIIRLSGSEAYNIINKLTHVEIKKESDKIDHVKLYDLQGNLLDDVLLMKFVEPKSFTGEDLIEINCHGNPLLAEKIISNLVLAGATIAEKGEFSRRALLNNKMNSIQLFAMNNLIHSSNDISMKYSLNTLLNKKVRDLDKYEEELFKIIGRIEVLIDYPEFNDDNREELTHEFLINFTNRLIRIFESLIHDSKILLPFYNGIDIAIVGVANAGKSSLLNKLINKDKAIVSEFAGTTRDVVEATLNIDNRILNLKDTAGIHNTKDVLENIGIKKSLEAIDTAKFIIMVIDGNDDSNYSQEKEIYELIKNKPHLIVINKSDLPLKTKWNGIKISTIDNSYLKLLEIISNKLNELSEVNLINDYSLQDQRQLDNASVILNNLQIVRDSLYNDFSFDMVIDDLHRILHSFQELIGKTEDVDFIDRLFANFCVGK